MVKILKPGKVVIVTRGKYAGKKGIVVKSNDVGTKSRPYGHAVVAGISKGPRRVKKGMSKKLILKRTRIHPFLKVINHAHVMPTRYQFELKASKIGTKAALTDRAQKKKAIGRIRHQFTVAFRTGQKKWFFTPLQF
jgi:large subunit ribosomal protein L27e